MVNEAFPDPFGGCCFVEDQLLYICVFHSYTLTHHHCIWDIKNRSVKGELGKLAMTCNMKNFPYKSFYSETREEVFTFYRQNQVLMVDPQNP